MSWYIQSWIIGGDVERKQPCIFSGRPEEFIAANPNLQLVVLGSWPTRVLCVELDFVTRIVLYTHEEA